MSNPNYTAVAPLYPDDRVALDKLRELLTARYGRPCGIAAAVRWAIHAAIETQTKEATDKTPTVSPDIAALQLALRTAQFPTPHFLALHLGWNDRKLSRVKSEAISSGAILKRDWQCSFGDRYQRRSQRRPALSSAAVVAVMTTVDLQPTTDDAPAAVQAPAVGTITGIVDGVAWSFVPSAAPNLPTFSNETQSNVSSNPIGATSSNVKD